MILLFLIDTSASMNQRTESGFTFLDLAKGAVEKFINLRLRMNARDRYFLVTTSDGPAAVKVGWSESAYTDFMNALKNLVANDLRCVPAHQPEPEL